MGGQENETEEVQPNQESERKSEEFEVRHQREVCRMHKLGRKPESALADRKL